MSVKRWLWCLVVGGALACRGDKEHEAERARQEAPDAGSVLVSEAQRPPDGGMPDGGRFRYRLEEDVGPLEPGQCPPGQHRCCDGSCSSDKRCPGISCDPVPTMKE